MSSPVRKAIFPVGGLGTRFLPATKAMPKELLPVVDKPLIQYAVEEAAAAGIEEFVFVTGRGKAAIEDHFDVSYELEKTLGERGRDDVLDAIRAIGLEPGEISYTRQMDPMGLGHAVWCARKHVGNEPVAVLLADDLIMSGAVFGATVMSTKRPAAMSSRSRKCRTNTRTVMAFLISTAMTVHELR